MQSTDERYKAKVTVLTESVRHHVEEEEKELFPDVRKLLSHAELVDLGAELRAAKKSAPAQSSPAGPRRAARQHHRQHARRATRRPRSRSPGGPLRRSAGSLPDSAAPSEAPALARRRSTTSPER